MESDSCYRSSISFYVAIFSTAFCVLFVFWALGFSNVIVKQQQQKKKNSSSECVCSKANGEDRQQQQFVEEEEEDMMVERQTGASMMEQLVPEITTHTLSYLDYPSLCRLSMTNSLMRKAANDDTAWKALYHKGVHIPLYVTQIQRGECRNIKHLIRDFTLEQDSITPPNGWKAYYAATRAVVNVNAEFYNIIRERSLPAMSRFWLQADYVKCVHSSGELFTGYNAVIQSWQIAFNWGQGVAFQVRDVRARVLTDMAWITMKAYVDMDTGPFHVTNVYEFNNGQWYMVHHHSSMVLGAQ